ncbi:MAG TPA: 2-oxo-4-hydroxy-4-carboxy-5-ureidoimidazoline decarboxylase [Pyrinomonadaceae bacterium]|nr:2-oxo-4-hydroxy-4-carboxy-5-ureidoimidazoline decarboxylase [Pyrinomonadaceae bacterium]
MRNAKAQIMTDSPTFQIYKNLAWLNDLPEAQAESAFRDCCGSVRWARRMALARPFRVLDDLYETAEKLWWSLSPGDHLEAFAAHPKIGSKGSATGPKAKSAQWSKGEQSRVEGAPAAVRRALAEANRLYEKKFGFIFIVCATGKSAEEMLAICKARLGNSVETEIRLAAEEQRKITEIRLNKLLER